MYELLEYLDERGSSPFGEWLRALDATTAARIDRHLRRMEAGNLGDWKAVGRGVRELRADFGPGWRIYHGQDGQRLIILLGGGSKRHQQRDIAQAQKRWQDYIERKKRKGH